MEKRREYSKPFLMAEKFEPQEFVAICEVPHDMLWSPVHEDNNIPGWQEHNVNLPSGGHVDNYYGLANSRYLSLVGYQVRHIKAEDATYDNDNSASYWEIVLTEPGYLYKKDNHGHLVIDTTKPTVPAGSIFYKNYSESFFSGSDITKNYS